MKSIYEYGEKVYELPHLDFNLVKTPKYIKRNNEIIDKYQEKIVLNYCLKNINSSSLAILLALYTGIRSSELAALQYSDINIENKTITITKAVNKYEDENHNIKNKVTELKNWAQRRQIVMPDFLFYYFLDYSNTYHHQNNDYILSSSNKFIAIRIIQYNVNKISQELNIDLNLNVLRKTFYNNCIEKGMDIKVLMDIMGISNLTISTNEGEHTSIERKKEQINRIFR